MYKYVEKNVYKIYFALTDSLKCTPSDRQMYRRGYMYPRLGTPALATQKIDKKII